MKKSTCHNKPSWNFSLSFRNFFEVFASSSKFSDLLGLVQTCTDALGCIRMRLDASGCVRMRPENFEFFWWKNIVLGNCRPFSDEILKNGRHQQLPWHFLLHVNLFGARYDPWSSFWHGVPTWDGLRERRWPVPGVTAAFIQGVCALVLDQMDVLRIIIQ